MPNVKNKPSDEEFVREFLSICDSVEDTKGTVFATDQPLVQPSAKAKAAAQQLVAGLSKSDDRRELNLAAQLDRLHDILVVSPEAAEERGCA